MNTYILWLTYCTTVWSFLCNMYFFIILTFLPHSFLRIVKIYLIHLLYLGPINDFIDLIGLIWLNISKTILLHISVSDVVHSSIAHKMFTLSYSAGSGFDSFKKLVNSEPQYFLRIWYQGWASIFAKNLASVLRLMVKWIWTYMYLHGKRFVGTP